MIALSGLRGVGKTTLMWQVAEFIYKEHTREIYSINVDDLNRLGCNLYEAIQVLEKRVFEQPLSEIQQPVVFLIDEVHEAKEWDKDLKILYEKNKQVFVLCTGSSALLLHKSPDLVTRWTLLRLFPFRFSEFILAKSWAKAPDNQLLPQTEMTVRLRQALFYSYDHESLVSALKEIGPIIVNYLEDVDVRFPEQDITALINEYISYHNIARFLQIDNREVINDRIIALFERILLKDIPEYSSVESSEKMYRLLLRLALSDEINYQKLAKDLRCKENEIEQFIHTLDKAEILNVFYPHGGLKSKTGQFRKAFFMSPSLRRALYSRIYGPKLEDTLRAKLFEDTVSMYLRMSIDNSIVSYGRATGSAVPDFIIETNDKPVLIEVGSEKNSVRQMKGEYQNKRYGILVNAFAKELTFKDDVAIMPLSWFLLL